MKLKRLWAAAGAALLLIGCQSAPSEDDTGAPPTVEATPGGARIVFETDRDGDHEIYVMNADGSGQSNLTNNPAYDGAPAFSPDGTRIAFVSERDGDDPDVWVMNADGSDPVNLTAYPGGDGYPTWSPEGARIGFDSYRDGASGGDIFTMSADGSDRINLTNTERDEGHPAWSSDGAWITFDAGGYADSETGNFAIYAVSVADGTVVQITDLSGNAGDAAWHPDSQRVVYSSNRDGAAEGNYELYLINVDGTGDQRITEVEGADTDPSISPDGLRVAFDSDRDGDSEIYVMALDGNDLAQLTNNDAWDGMPSWSRF